MPGAFGRVEELLREGAAHDSNFLKAHTVFFELRIGHRGGPSESHLFPLVVPPRRTSTEERFLVEYTNTATGGLVADENGINRRPIRISGNFGWAPKAHAIPPDWEVVEAPSKSHSRSVFYALSALSGKRHLEFLQDKVFRLYGDLKSNPESAEGTQLIYHCPTDEEHFLVLPEVFRIHRESEGITALGSPDWEIELSAVAPAEAIDADFSPDKSILEQLHDALARARAWLDLGRAAVDDILSVVEGIRAFIADIDALVNSVTSFYDDIGVALDAGIGLVGSLGVQARAIGKTFGEDLPSRLEALGDRAVEDWRHVRAAMHDIADVADALAAVPPSDLAAPTATTTTPATMGTISSLSSLNSAPALPGEARRNQALDAIAAGGGAAATYPSTSELEVRRTDTIESIAARALGDSSLWRRIAELNRLRHPFISPDGLPGTLAPGDRILVPSRSPSPAQRAASGVIATSPRTPLEERLFGVDVAWTKLPLSGGPYGWALAASGGDFRLVRGRDCLRQGIEVRVRTDRGSDGLYPSLGKQRVVGLNMNAIDSQMAQLRLIQTVAADPRVLTVKRVIRRTTSGPDTEVSMLEVIPRGLSGSIPIELPRAA